VDLRDLLGIDHAVVQAGMGGGLSAAPLAGAVSRAGALGTVGIDAPRRFAAQLREARSLAEGRPVSANLLMPFVRRAHVRACIDAGVGSVSLFFGFDRDAVRALREAGIAVLHQVGTAEQARRAIADGADVLVAQGSEAGGHLLAEQPLARALPAVLGVAGGRPVLAAGGIADAADVRRALDAGAAGVWCGSRFLLTEESGAHPEYLRRAAGAQRTLVTRLFGLAWPDRHRVVPNAATDRWEAGGPLATAAGLVNRATRPLAKALPLDRAAALRVHQRVAVPLYVPSAPLAGDPERSVETSPLYAGDAVARMPDVIPAAEAVARLVG
jgi:NAD(P)H-dependent flavin oxidoreductase YrpB (nitropropane dioxygenase family)